MDVKSEECSQGLVSRVNETVQKCLCRQIDGQKQGQHFEFCRMDDDSHFPRGV